jgi:hypothetical protein
MSQSGLKRALFASAMLIFCLGCAGQLPATYKANKERPVVNPPAAIRQGNWYGDKDEGSCVHATMVTLLRWQGRYAMADHWRRTYGNASGPEDLAAKLDREHIRYAYTFEQRDVGFLEWACRTRRGCGVAIQGGQHMIALVHLDAQWAGLLDDNATDHYIWVPRERFIAEWLASDSWAVTPLYAPAAPLPPS